MFEAIRRLMSPVQVEVREKQREAQRGALPGLALSGAPAGELSVTASRQSSPLAPGTDGEMAWKAIARSEGAGWSAAAAPDRSRGCVPA